jgi:Ca-activated chloride channel family protein
MTFAWPYLLWLLLIPAALLAAELLRRRRAAAVGHPKILHAEAGTHDLALVEKPAASHRSRPWLCAGLILAILALARPQWGRLEEPVFDQAREIIIAIDLSRSMLSQDVKPSRLERAKLLTQSLLEKLSGERVGLITFSGTAFLQSPLSSDYEILREFLPALNPDFLPEGGTNYRALIDTAVSAFGATNAADRFLIVLSDGEATDDDWKPEVPELKKKGIRVIGLGVGTAGGAMIPDGSGGFMKDERGAVVLSKLESGTLQELAEVTNGTYRDASTWIDLASVLRSTVEAGQKGRFLEKTTVRLAERFQWPLALGLWCLLVSFCYEFPVHPKPRELKLRGKVEGEKSKSESPDSKPESPNPKSTKLATTATVAVLILLSGIGYPQSTMAAAEPAEPPPPLAKIVSRLSTQDEQSARDWAELARETVTWGQHIQSESRPVPSGPVHDALSATELGEALNPKTADWPKLREDLAALLKTPDEQKPPPQNQQDQPDQKQQKQDQSDQQNQNQQNQSQSKQNRQKPDSSPQSKPSQDSSSQPQQQDSSPQSKPKPESGSQSPSAFGDMKDVAKQPPPSGEMQKVGGTPEKKDADKTPVDPQLALPLQKLDQLRNQDSPAELFQLMDPDKKPATKKPGKDW